MTAEVLEFPNRLQQREDEMVDRLVRRIENMLVNPQGDRENDFAQLMAKITARRVLDDGSTSG